MAGADYKHCDVCRTKAFYDANLNYVWDADQSDFIAGESYKLDYLGDWAVLCLECAKTHEAIVRKKDDAVIA